MSGVLHGVAAAAQYGAYLLTTTTYSQSSVYTGNNAATWEYMNNGTADGTANEAQTGTDFGGGTEWIKAALGSELFVDNIVIGYDFLQNLPGGWSPYYTENLNIQGSTNNSTWTTITTTPSYSGSGSTNGLVKIPIQGSWSYIRLANPGGYVCALEFQIWVT